MRVVKLSISNIKRVTAVEIIPGPHSVVISGSNDSGKSSTLDSIEYVLSGGKSIPEMPLRQGARSGYIVADLGDIVVERTFSSSGTNLTVKSKDGQKLSRPQDLLDSLCSKVSFDPLAFVRMKPEQQAEMLKKLVNLDFTELNNKRKKAYDDRTVVNRQLEQKSAALAGIAEVTDAPEAEVSVQDVVNKLKEAQKHNKAIEDACSEFNDHVNEDSQTKADIKVLEDQVVEIQKKIASKQEYIIKLATYITEKKAEIDKMVAIDTDAIEAEMTTIDQRNTKFRQAQRRKEVAEEVKSLKAQADKLTDDIQTIDEYKNDQVAKAKFPIEGLSFDEVGVMLNNVPFSQGSQARQLQAAIAIGIALNPTIRIILVRDASLLDEASLTMVKEMAEKHDAQVWLEIVSSNDPQAVIIEDGKVKE